MSVQILRDRLMVGRRPLEPRILVRVQVPQPFLHCPPLCYYILMSKFKKLYFLPLSFLSFIAFIKIAEEVIGNETIVTLDKIITSFMYTIRTPFLTDIMILFTDLGNPWVIAAISFISSFVFIYLKHRRELIYFLFSLAFSAAFVSIVKIIFARQRPAFEHALVIENTFSFPSGHSLLAVTFYGLLIFFGCKVIKKKNLRSLLIAFGIFMISMIAFSRIYLGVHWTSDVLGGLLAGIGWLSFVIFLVENKFKQ